jgi:hypothetical protein
MGLCHPKARAVCCASGGRTHEKGTCRNEHHFSRRVCRSADIAPCSDQQQHHYGPQGQRDSPSYIRTKALPTSSAVRFIRLSMPGQKRSHWCIRLCEIRSLFHSQPCTTGMTSVANRRMLVITWRCGTKPPGLNQQMSWSIRH